MVIINLLKKKYYLNKYSLFSNLLIPLILSGCGSTMNQKITELHLTSDSETNYISCSGRGELHSKGEYKGKLKFTYFSQNDSTVIQFRDFMGRKTLIMWIEKDNVNAWDILKNRQYYNDEIMSTFPIINRLNPTEFTKLLWGESPIITDESILGTPENGTIEISINKGDSTQEELVDKVIFKEKLHNSSVTLSIVKRTLNQDKIELGNLWKMKPS